MSRESNKKRLLEVLKETPIFSMENFSSLSTQSSASNQNNTNDAFSKKWADYNDADDKNKWFEMQKEWYLKLYGFSSEKDFKNFLSTKQTIYDAGCGMGYKAAWFAELAPHSTVIGVDFSETAELAAQTYSHIPNLFFLRADIAEPLFHENSIDYVNCDQVIMHTEDPALTFRELSKAITATGQFACYFYAKKALPRELLDDFFRTECSNMSHGQLKDMSEQLTELGKRLSKLNVSFEAPEIPALGIKGGEIDIQRFIYWNFLKCYWNEEMGDETSSMINYDWYSPSNAQRFSKEEVMNLVSSNDLSVVHFHAEEACYSGLFEKISA